MSHHADPSPWVFGLMALVYVGAQVRERAVQAVERWRRSREPDPLEKLHQRFKTTDMTVDEFERRLEDLLEPCDEEMRRRLEDVEDVGDHVATEVAIRFDSIEHVRQASRRELEAVPDIGPARADAIAEFFD